MIVKKMMNVLFGMTKMMKNTNIITTMMMTSVLNAIMTMSTAAAITTTIMAKAKQRNTALALTFITAVSQ